ncbi:MAG: HAMP domain-containing histidine kinase [Acidobacteriia bacterium]|nr:HAMP domain-containing histidine kinase [Terriglobia bacterium]
MVFSGRRKSIAFFIALGAGLISVILLLYIGWVLLNWRTGLLLFLGILLLAVIIGGVVLNTLFLVREIRRNEQHDAFINAVTHELKTPVASIRLYLETLQTHRLEDAKRDEFYRTMLADSDRLLGTIEQVLRTGRLGPGNRKLNLDDVRLRAVVEDCVRRAGTLYHLLPEALKIEEGPEITIRGDPDEIQAAVSNLIDNAVKYSDQSVSVTVAIRPEAGRYVSLRVTDRGAGIPGSELKRIFRRFYRAPGALAMRVKGTGLGLYIVRSVARRHGGRTWAESKGPGHGSTFVLQLPISR